jgi:hypothetical protein
MKLQRWIFGTLLCLVLIKPLLFILALGVPIFFQDEWVLVPFLERIWHGQANFHDYWMASAEHRIFLPRLIFAAVYRPGSVDPRQVMGHGHILVDHECRLQSGYLALFFKLRHADLLTFIILNQLACVQTHRRVRITISIFQLQAF